MHVLHVVPNYLPATRYGGLVFATHALCAALVRCGCRVTVFTTNLDGGGISPVPVDTPVVRDGVEIRYFSVPIGKRLCYSRGLGRALDVDATEFDLVHLHSVFLWPTWAGYRAAVDHGIPYLLAPRGMLVKELVTRKSTIAKQGWIALVGRRIVESASGIHVTSSVEARELRRFGFRLPPVYEVPNGVGTETEDQNSTALPDDVLGLLKSGRPIILALGRISWKKGLDRLVEALPHLPAAWLLVVGNDDEGYSRRLRELAEQFGVIDRTVFSGPVYGATKSDLYRKATLLALPSHSENFGNVVLEAMAEGCPVVVTPEVGAASIVKDSGGGLVADRAPPEFASALKQLISDPDLRNAMGSRGQEWVTTRYSWDRIAAQMIDVYRRVLQERNHGT